MSVQVGWNRDSGILVGSLVGRIDSSNSVECADALRSGIGDDERSLILNLSGLDYISSAGLRVLLMMAKKFTGTGQTFGLCELPARISDVITASGFGDIISVHESQNAAVAAAGGVAPTQKPAAEKAPEDTVALASSIDMGILGDNVSDIATFTIEKHEFANPALPADLREKAYAAISSALWEEVEVILARHKKLLAGLVQTAATTLDAVLASEDD